jgi:integrase
LLGLCWPDVDIKRGALTFHETKNGERRAVPLTGQALSLMRQHAKGRRLDTTLVFPNATGKRPLGIREAFEGAVKHADITDLRCHDLRHTAASYLAMSGTSLAETAKVLGHKTLAMVRRYSHLTEGHTRGVVERMNRAAFGEPQPGALGASARPRPKAPEGEEVATRACSASRPQSFIVLPLTFVCSLTLLGLP